MINIDKKAHIENKRLQFGLKRLMDITLSFIGIIILLPIYLIIIIAIKLDSKGATVFKQVRVGKDGKNFNIYKFRTMIAQAESKIELNIDPFDLENFVFQDKSDVRITRVGKFLRCNSLDEIPQFFNVLFGQMSIVGPRPEIPEIVKYYPESYYQRLLVLPGITGLAQISGRGEIELGKTVTYDLDYIKNFSVQLDIKIIFLTVVSVFKKDGAY
ncbi:sugar transferase [Clostridium sp. CM028]|uniref:sugar transferase n=1 Tax=unclassified Clostridium TaxID=2614128 RepID=UPI001C0D6864|nr:MULTISPECIES: sugar transferase [unclassified Clostridium]MBU3093624.1 sugar transferase [Clostridium sp. CF011]MBW9146136.1 sugar transferase [Clostridium sp. CM027]MBW9148207.1 sugar transferase [Clostridium sp. CM028]UVE41687.1 sugar transferase [Clostridium sp. CM027]WAG70689.1 sugar transferase [Clostridium sp. CF011]